MKGNDYIVVARGEVLEIRTTGPFSILCNGEILGPNAIGDRLFLLKIPPGMREVDVIIEDEFDWSYKITPYDAAEDPPPGKIEGPLETPLTLREEMRRFIQEELSPIAADKGQESIEEANDFEIDDEEPDFLSQYEVAVLEMEPEYQQEGPSEAVEGSSQDVPPNPDPNPVQQEETPPESAQEAGAAAG